MGKIRYNISTTAAYLAIFTFVIVCAPSVVRANSMLDFVKPGVGYNQFKQWAIKNTFCFENFTRESLVTCGKISPTIRVKFCGGDDYAGRAFSITIIEKSSNAIAMIRKFQKYISFLSAAEKKEASNQSGNTHTVRTIDGRAEGVAIGQSVEGKKWDVGLVVEAGGAVVVQTKRIDDTICR